MFCDPDGETITINIKFQGEEAYPRGFDILIFLMSISQPNRQKLVLHFGKL